MVIESRFKVQIECTQLVLNHNYDGGCNHKYDGGGNHKYDGNVMASAPSSPPRKLTSKPSRVQTEHYQNI